MTSPPYGDQQVTASSNFFSEKDGRGNLAKDGHHKDGYAPAGAITSPPYGDLTLGDGSGVSWKVRKVAIEQGMDAAVKFYRKEVMDTQPAHGRWSDENIRRHIEMALATAENGGYSAAGAITSPPFFGVVPKQDRNFMTSGERGSKPGNLYRPDTDYGKGAAQIGNLRDPKNDIDAVLSSPPYANRLSDKPKRQMTSRLKRENPSFCLAYSENAENIGQMPEGQTYCAAILEVYRGLHATLKPCGVVALVTKNPVKGGKIRRLDTDTIRLMEAAGFVLIERVMAMLVGLSSTQTGMFGEDKTTRTERKSFFKRLHEKKFPHLAVDHEDVLFFRKASPAK